MKANKKEIKKIVGCAVCKYQDDCNSKLFGQGCGDLVIHSKYYEL